LLRNVEEKTRYVLPFIADEDKRSANNSSKKSRKKTPSRLSMKIDQGVSNRSSPRRAKKSARRNDISCQTTSQGIDACTMTIGESQSEQLAKMIKIEAEKTIQMLELFMNASKDQRAIQPVDAEEVQQKTKEDLMNDIKKITNEENDEESTHEVNYTEEDDLFSGMENKLPSQTIYAGYLSRNRDNRMPFSKYVEDLMKRGNISLSVGSQTKQFDESETLLKSHFDFKSNIGRNEDSMVKDSFKALKKNKLRIHHTQNLDANAGKFFKVRLKPLHQNKEKVKEETTTSDFQNYRTELDKPILIGK